METTTTRRAMFGILATPALAMALPAACYEAKASTSDFDAALLTYRKAKADHDGACSAYSIAQRAYFADRPVMPVGSPFYVGDTVETYNARVRAEKEARERADSESKLHHGVDAKEAAEAEACDAVYDALTALLETPAPDLRAVALKIEIAGRHGLDIDDLAAVLSDLRRFAGEA